ncbi:hypothetical protein MED121_23800 [Marinomonas sp. MED121]|nr:hypothetical protein MED121_23800 [Marinomonas sp. MED121]
MKSLDESVKAFQVKPVKTKIAIK